MHTNRDKALAISGVILVCCMGVFAFCIRYFLQNPEAQMPRWFGYTCGIAAIVGIVSFAVFVTSIVFGSKDSN
jgi:hypothetical protein